ncbi:MAG: hypothetical protein COX48_04250 [bacterium (Candidatus Stahlbacteria) CG23_combo_of_CG06-09_8_20_14_all_34_7]|nr:MAG: hypothetical protein COX48_04250 [bacterium (Candidatus Stahlbacteria) CG23_combo_of_CG06-09_8_20_14_all_34_7]
MIKQVINYISVSVYETLRFFGVFKYINMTINFSKVDKKRLLIDYYKQHKFLVLILLSSILLIYISFRFGINKPITVLVVILFGMFTHLFSEILAIIALIPIAGPIIVKIISIPIIILLNGIGYIITFFAFKKGYKVEIAKSKIFTTALLIGIVFGYLLGKLI